MKKVGFGLCLLAALCFSMPAFGACVDVETASAKQLEALKGVGPTTATAIVNYRKRNRTKATKAKKKKWMFKNWATLIKVKGVSAKICQDNLATVCFSATTQKACPKKKGKTAQPKK